MKADSLSMYGPSNFFGNHMRASRLASRCRSLSCWLCLFLALPASVIAWDIHTQLWPWHPNFSLFIPFTSMPSRFYSESEILSHWISDGLDSYVPSSSLGSLSDVYSYLSNDETLNRNLTPPILCCATNYHRLITVDEDYLVSTQNLVSVSLAPVLSRGVNGNQDQPPDSFLFPFWFSSYYGFGFDFVEDAKPSSPAFGNFITTNNFVQHPWNFQDWQESGPLVWRMQDVRNLSYFRGSSAYFSGATLTFYETYYSFPESPLSGQIERGKYPVRHSRAFEFVDEYYLPWYWQTVQGIFVFEPADNVKIRNVLRFHSSSTNQPEGM